MAEERDEELGAAIRQLYVPPPREDFSSTLLDQLKAEEATTRPAAQLVRRRRGLHLPGCRPWPPWWRWS